MGAVAPVACTPAAAGRGQRHGHIIGVTPASRGRCRTVSADQHRTPQPEQRPAGGGLVSGVRALYPKHPELLLECARDRDQEILRNRVVAGYDFDACSRAGRDFGHAVGDLPDHVVVPGGRPGEARSD